MSLARLLQYRRWIFSGYVALLLIGFLGIGQLGVNPNNRVFFGPGDAQFEELLEFESEFGSNTSILFAITSEEDAFSNPALIEAVVWLTDAVWQVEGVVRVDSLSTYPYGEFSEEEISISTLQEALCPRACRSEAAYKLFEAHLVNRLVGGEGRTLTVIASVELDSEDSVAVSRINQDARDLIGQFQLRFPSLEIHATGAVPMMQAFMDASNEDLGGLIGVAVLLFILVLWIFLRGLFMTATLVVLGISSIVITLGLAGLAGHIVNTATATTPLVIFTLVVAGSMHIFLYVARDVCDGKEQVHEAVNRALLANVAPVLLAAVTSIVGLLSLAFVSAPPIKQLGVLSALGVVVGTSLLLLVVPCVLSAMTKVRPSPALSWLQQLLNEMARRVEVGKDKVFGFGIFFAILVLAVPILKVDEDFVRYFGPENAFRVNSEAITERLAGPYHVEIVVDTGVSGGIYEPSIIENVQELVGKLRGDGRVANVLSVADILREVAGTLTGVEEIGDMDSGSLAQYFLSFELALAKGQSTTDFVDVGHQKVRISVLLADVSMAEIRAFEDDVRRWAESNLEFPNPIQITGEGIPTAHLSSNSIRQLAVGIVVSLLFSSCLLGIYYRDGRVVGVTLLATTVPVLAGFGVWGLAIGEIGMAATVVVAVTIGVVIDDSIHLLYRYADGLRSLSLSHREAAAYSLHRTGTAVATTSFVLASGFSVLMLSEFRMNSAFGICAALVIVLALVYNTTLMPRALTKVRLSRPESEEM
jgi:predicted RND superfamily exporter protein